MTMDLNAKVLACLNEDPGLTKLGLSRRLARAGVSEEDSASAIDAAFPHQDEVVDQPKPKKKK